MVASRDKKNNNEEERFRRKANLPARLLRFFRHASFRVDSKGVVVVEICGTHALYSKEGRKKHHVLQGNVFRVYKKP